MSLPTVRERERERKNEGKRKRAIICIIDIVKKVEKIIYFFLYFCIQNHDILKQFLWFHLVLRSRIIFVACVFGSAVGKVMRFRRGNYTTPAPAANSCLWLIKGKIPKNVYILMYGSGSGARGKNDRLFASPAPKHTSNFVTNFRLV
jgi:hypothetical protein